MSDREAAMEHTEYVLAQINREQEAELTQLRAERDRLREALKPFSHEVFTQRWGGNGMGDDSPAWGRNSVLLTIGDFRRARAALTQREGGEDERPICTIAHQ